MKNNNKQTKNYYNQDISADGTSAGYLKQDFWNYDVRRYFVKNSRKNTFFYSFWHYCL